VLDFRYVQELMLALPKSDSKQIKEYMALMFVAVGKGSRVNVIAIYRYSFSPHGQRTKWGYI